ncbi:Xenotropic and polytropic retrovirus receptor 1 [Elasticomyces elasticus]
MQYVALSVWRIYGGDHLMAFFIAAASVNSIYCIFWDLEYDWSMPLNPRAKPYPLLRSTLAYRKRIWWYYTAIIIDPILRCNWIFYIIFRGDVQHSSIVSFLIAFSEVIRRGIWVLFRVENEHCANVGRSRAMRDPELPYELDNQPAVPSVANYAAGIAQQSDGTTEDPLVLSAQHSRASGRDVEQGTPATASLRRRQGGVAEPEGAQDSPVYRALQRVGTTFLTAHAQDYERKRKGSDGGSKKDAEGDKDGEDEDSDSDS